MYCSETFEVWPQSNWAVCEMFQQNIKAILCGLVTLKQRPSVRPLAQQVHEVDISFKNLFSNSVTIEPEGKLHYPNSALPHFGYVNATPGPPSVHSQHSKFWLLISFFKDSIAFFETSAIDAIKSNLITLFTINQFCYLKRFFYKGLGGWSNFSLFKLIMNEKKYIYI